MCRIASAIPTAACSESTPACTTTNSADAGHQISLLHQVAQPRSRGSDQLVAGGMPEGIVDVLELVHVDEVQGNLGATPLRGGQLLLQTVTEQAPVRQVCQVIVRRQPVQLAAAGIALPFGI
jgi:hypothetical protein